MRKKLKIFTAALCSAAVSLNIAVPYLHAEISQDGIDYLGLPIDDSADAKKYFPDEQFRKYLQNEVDSGAKDNHLSDAEIEAVKEINIDSTYAGIKNVNGIEIFSNLERFICQDLVGDGTTDAENLSLKFSDPSQETKKYGNVNAKLKYVNCNHSKVTGIDLTGCPDVEYLNCSDNELADTDLKISENTKLKYLYCSNTKLTTPDLSKNTELKVLDCSFKKDDDRPAAGETGVFNPTDITGSVSKLNLATNAKLEYLDCSGNGNLSELTLASDFGGAAYLKGNALKYVDCHGCGLTSLDLQHGTLLQYLNCSGNSISNLDIRKNTKLEYLDCSGVVDPKTGNITTVNMPLTLGNDSVLRTLDCSNNVGITALNNIEYNTSLETLNCAGTELTALDLSKNTALESLICEERIYATDTSQWKDGPDSKITDLKINRLLNKKAGLSFNDIFGNMNTRNKITIDDETDADGNKIDSNVDIYYTDNALDVINVVAKDVTKPAIFKEVATGTTKRTITYTNLDSAAADLAVPAKEGDYTLANCTHLYKDVNRTSVINGEPVIVYANGASKKVTLEDGTSVKKNSGNLIVYTDIAASYKVNENGRVSTGKVVVGITETPDIPTVNGNKIDGASNVATAKIQHGKVTVKAKKNAASGSGGVYYLWVIDTGSNGTYECCPINILVAPNKLAMRNKDDNDPQLKDATRMIGEELEVYVAGYADTGKTMRTMDSTYECTVPDSVKDCVDIEQKGPDHFIIKAKAVKNNKDTKVNLTFTCGQNNKKIKFVLKVSAAPLGTPASSPSASTLP